MADNEKERFRAEVIAAITTAFQNVCLNGGVTLHQANAMDERCDSELGIIYAREKDTETTWLEIPDEKLKHFNDVLVFLDAKGWIFYIPAFMIWVLRHHDDADGEHRDFNESPIFNFSYEVKLKSSWLNDEQRQAVYRFLEYLVLYDVDLDSDADRALRLGWNRFERVARAAD